MPHFVMENHSQPATQGMASTGKYQTNPILLLTHCDKTIYANLKRTQPVPFQPNHSQPATQVMASREKYQTNPILPPTRCFKTTYLNRKQTHCLPNPLPLPKFQDAPQITAATSHSP